MSNEVTLALNARIQQARMLCVISLVLLIAVCVAWESFLAPLRSGGSWMVLKVLPLLAILPSVKRPSLYLPIQQHVDFVLFYRRRDAPF